MITAPTERVKVVLQTSESGSFLGAARTLIREGGVRSLFQGTLATLARDGPGSALYFASYEVSKRFLSRNQDTDALSVVSICVAGGAVSYTHLAYRQMNHVYLSILLPDVTSRVRM